MVETTNWKVPEIPRFLCAFLNEGHPNIAYLKNKSQH